MLSVYYITLKADKLQLLLVDEVSIYGVAERLTISSAPIIIYLAKCYNKQFIHVNRDENHKHRTW